MENHGTEKSERGVEVGEAGPSIFLTTKVMNVMTRIAGRKVNHFIWALLKGHKRSVDVQTFAESVRQS